MRKKYFPYRSYHEIVWQTKDIGDNVLADIKIARNGLLDADIEDHIVSFYEIEDPKNIITEMETFTGKARLVSAEAWNYGGYGHCQIHWYECVAEFDKGKCLFIHNMESYPMYNQVPWWYKPVVFFRYWWNYFRIPRKYRKS